MQKQSPRIFGSESRIQQLSSFGLIFRFTVISTRTPETVHPRFSNYHSQNWPRSPSLIAHSVTGISFSPWQSLKMKWPLHLTFLIVTQIFHTVRYNLPVLFFNSYFWPPRTLSVNILNSSIRFKEIPNDILFVLPLNFHSSNSIFR